jgi:CubicO group peptidase (beta-lactamase class C family)
MSQQSCQRTLTITMTKTLNERIEAILAPYNRSDAPGCTVAISQHGQTLYRNGFGLANFEHGVANLPATRMPIASVTKHFACAAVLQLASEGKLSLDDPIGRWLPELSEVQRKPTLNRLMNHSSGLRCYLEFVSFNGLITMPAGLPFAIQARQSEVNFEPGEGQAYCNGGYHLLSLAVQRAASQPLGEFLAERFFKPLRMEATNLPLSRWPLERGVATKYLPHGPDGMGWRHGVDLTEELLGDGGLVSSADDMLRWAQFLTTANGPVSLATLAVQTTLANGSVSGYGLGLHTEEWRGVKIVHHGGGLIGAACFFVMAPEEGVALMVMFNRMVPVRQIALQLLEAVLPDRVVPAPPEPHSADHAVLLGHHYLVPDTGFMFAFADVGGRLGLSVYGGPAGPLEGCGTDHGDVSGQLPFGLTTATGDLRFRLPADAGSPPTAIDMLDAGTWRRAERLQGAAPAPQAVLDDAAGTFYSADAAATLQLGLDDGKLVLRSQGEFGANTFAAEALAPDVLRYWPKEIPGGELLRLERKEGHVHALVKSSTRTRRLVFVRQAEAA